jgi:hypothetical protein
VDKFCAKRRIFSLVRIPVEAKFFSSSHGPERIWGPPASYSMSNGGSFPAVQMPGREANHSPPISAEVKNTWIYTSTHIYAFVASCFISYAQEHLHQYLTVSKPSLRMLSDGHRRLYPRGKTTKA